VARRDCYQDATVARKGELSTAEAFDVVDQTVEAGAHTFVFTGGEPFSRPDLLEIARYSRSRELQTNVITNGHYITARTVEEVARTFDRITVSLDSGIAEHHDRARGHGSWKKAAGAIDLLLGAGATVAVNSVITRLSLPDVTELLAFIRDRKIKRHNVSFQSPMGRGANSRSEELLPDELIGMDDHFYRKELSCGTCAKDSCFAEKGRAAKGDFRDHCGAGFSELAVDPQGWVFPCKILQYDQYRAGNVRNQRLVEIFSTHPVFTRIQQPFVGSLKPCSTCIIKNSCGGGCRGIHASYTGAWDIAEPLFCAHLRRSFEVKAFASTGAVPPRRHTGFARSGTSTVLSTLGT